MRTRSNLRCPLSERQSIDRSFEATKAGVAGSQVYTLVCELFEENGQRTSLSKAPGEVLLAGFDLVPVVLEEMQNGYIQVTVDQQPYLQGYYPVHQLHLYNNYQFPPFDVNTGKALITPDQVEDLVKLSQEGIR
jgi:hypothetical protein